MIIDSAVYRASSMSSRTTTAQERLEQRAGCRPRIWVARIYHKTKRVRLFGGRSGREGETTRIENVKLKRRGPGRYAPQGLWRWLPKMRKLQQYERHVRGRGDVDRTRTFRGLRQRLKPTPVRSGHCALLFL